MNVTSTVTFLSAALTVGAVYALIAYGYNIIFATTGVLNFAHGQMFMAGTMLGVFFYGSLGLPVVAALIVTVLAVGVLASFEELLAVRPTRRIGQDPKTAGWVLSTLGASVAIQAGFSLVFGSRLRAFPNVLSFGDIHIGGARVDPERVLLVAFAILIGVLLHLFYQRSMLGKALDAVAQDSEAASVRGIHVSSLSSLSFALGSAITAAGAFLTAPLIAASPTLGLSYGLKGFVVAAVGGMPSIKGALIAGMLLGILEEGAGTLLGTGYRNAVVFLVLLILLYRRPAGLFGVETVRAV